MELEILQDRPDIERAMASFKTGLARQSSGKVKTNLGFPGGSLARSVYFFRERTIWFSPDGTLPRYWNAFGSAVPVGGKTLPIDVEINFPKTGIDRRIAGAFVRDPRTGQLFVVHRGKIGGGRQGVSKTIFWEHFRGDKIRVLDGGRETHVALISALRSRRLLAQIEFFVAEVGRIKKIATKAGPRRRASRDSFRAEFSGLKAYAASGSVEARCDHGIIVNTLAEDLRSRFIVANDRNRDLFVVGRGGRTDVLFEVKTDCHTGSLYSAIGQLMMHGRTGTVRPLLVAVFPSAYITTRLRARFTELGIEVVGYSWQRETKPSFKGLLGALARRRSGTNPSLVAGTRPRVVHAALRPAEGDAQR